MIRNLKQEMHCMKRVQYGVFSSPHLPAFEPEKAPYLDTFHAVMSTMNNKKQPPEVFYRRPVYKNFSIFTRKHLSPFNQVAGLQVGNFIIKRFQHGCFSVNIAKFLKTLF